MIKAIKLASQRCIAWVSRPTRVPTLIWVGLPLVLSTLLIAAVGPYWQMHTLPLATSVAPTIYDTIYPDQLARFPSLADWFIESISFVALAIAILTAAVALRANTCHGWAIGAGTTFAFAYTVYDFVVLISSEQEVNFLASAVANIAGGVFVSMVYYLFAAIIIRLSRSSLGRATYKVLIGGAILAIGFLISLLSLMLLIVFYRPLQAPLEMAVPLPFDGWVRAKVRSPDENEPSYTNRFSAVPTGAKSKEVEISSPHEAGKIAWLQTGRGSKTKLEVYALDGCAGGMNPSLTEPPAMTMLGVSSLSVDNGTSFISIRSPKDYKLWSVISEIAYLSVSPNDTGGLDIFSSARPLDRLEIEASDTVEILVSAILLTFGDEGAVSPQPQRLSFSVDGKPVAAVLSPKGGVNPKDKLKCSQLVPSENLDTTSHGQPAMISTSSLAGGLFFRLTPEPDSPYASTTSSLSVVETNGMIQASLLEMRAGSDFGDADYIGTSGAVRDVSVYGLQMSGGIDRLFAVGDFDVFLGPDKALRVSGEASALAQSGQRLNRTRWEFASDTVRWGALITAFGLVATSAAFVRRSIKGRVRRSPLWFFKTRGV